MDKKVKIFISTDPGVDDFMALICLLMAEKMYGEIEVVAMGSIGGNVDSALTQKNALGINALLDRTDIPVFAGAQQPLLKAAFTTAVHVHGDDGVQGFVLPHHLAAKPRTDMDAAECILNVTEENKDDPIKLIFIGPLTDLAIAYRRDPSLVDRVSEVLIMGGAYGNPSGNIGLPHQNGKDIPYMQEFNNGSDRLAAQIVYEKFHNIRAFPLDVTYKTLQTPEFRDWLKSKGEKGEDLARMLEAYAKTEGGVGGHSAPMHDINPVAAVTKPSLFSYQTGFVNVPQTGENQGQTVFTPDENGNVHVAVDVDVEGVFAFMQEMVGAYLSPAP